MHRRSGIIARSAFATIFGSAAHYFCAGLRREMGLVQFAIGLR
jgi:hypothetical protein